MQRRRQRGRQSSSCSVLPKASLVSSTSRIRSARRYSRNDRSKSPLDQSTRSRDKRYGLRVKASYADLSPLSKLATGTVETAVTTVLDYVTGFGTGYVLGSLTDVPRFLFSMATPKDNLMDFTMWGEAQARVVRMHSRSMRWAVNWASISAVYGGLGVIIKVARNGKVDEWNTIVSSAAAGAFFGRKQGPQGMVRTALMYGGVSYLLAGLQRQNLVKERQSFEGYRGEVLGEEEKDLFS